MSRSAGQPPKSSFEVVRTLYWFNTVKGFIKKELVAKCFAELRELESKRRSGLSVDKPRIRRSRNKLERLQGKGSYKKPDVKFSEIQSHLEEKEFQVNPNKLVTVDGIGKLSGKVWSRYASGHYTPSRILEDLTLIYPTSKAAYFDGPNDLFKILHANTLKEAVELVESAFLRLLRLHQARITAQIDEEQSLPKQRHERIMQLNKPLQICEQAQWSIGFQIPPHSTLHGFQRLLKLYRALHGPVSISNALSDPTNFYFDSFQMLSRGEAASLGLALAFIEFKFLGEEELLPELITCRYVLDVIQREYGIDSKSWFAQQNKQVDSVTAVFEMCLESDAKEAAMRKQYRELELVEELHKVTSNPEPSFKCGIQKSKNGEYWEVSIGNMTHYSDINFAIDSYEE